MASLCLLGSPNVLQPVVRFSWKIDNNRISGAYYASDQYNPHYGLADNIPFPIPIYYSVQQAFLIVIDLVTWIT